MKEKIIIAGFGGQGVIMAGKLIAYAGMLEGKFVSHIPSYGVEMRGGTANCSVVISDIEVASPLVPHPTTLIAMNQPSLDKFEKLVVENGHILVNSSLIERKVQREDVHAFYIPANNIAEEAGSGKAANIAMIGALLALMGVASRDIVKDSLKEVLSKRNLKYLDINYKALDLGYDYVQK
ncbi:MAG: 2-oxoacid:ferredoxin oxidoreductase subunit gamma [Spirochaetes bacterium DG_61]|jgi:2-oxoglutarate ferredoxin oxidoreductase subunit gamma|nr:MAG: 2-oxoacid:ferredoxin oxidoreductase subunit gamma [Spirochaetes bacterium DG_61]